MELTGIEKNKSAKTDAMTAAREARHPGVVLMILSDQAGCFAHMEAPDETP